MWKNKKHDQVFPSKGIVLIMHFVNRVETIVELNP